MPRSSDSIEQLFWVDDDGPVTAFVLTDWDRAWGCDALIVPGVPTVSLADAWVRAVDAISALELEQVEVLARDDDLKLLRLLADAGFVAGEDRSGITWLEADERPVVAAPPQGFTLVDRTSATRRPHPLRRRNGPAVELRLQQCTLYGFRVTAASTSYRRAT